MAFYTIYISDGLSQTEYERSRRAGAPGLASLGRSQPELLRSAGFEEIEEIDLTDEFLRVARAWGEARRRHAEALKAAEGADFDVRMRDNRTRVRAIEAGLQRRSLFVARRP